MRVGFSPRGTLSAHFRQDFELFQGLWGRASEDTAFTGRRKTQRERQEVSGTTSQLGEKLTLKVMSKSLVAPASPRSDPQDAPVFYQQNPDPSRPFSVFRQTVQSCR
jgi:hypothetical protein